MAITKITIDGIEYPIAKPATEEIQLYQGRELSEYSWTQIKEKIKNGDYSDLRIGDYKTVTLTTGETVRAQIAGIDTYINFGYPNVGHHIDFISIDCLNKKIKWRDTADNNGTDEERCPYMNSNVHSYLLNTVLPTIPSELQNIIVSKQINMENRFNYEGSGKLIDSLSSSLVDLGKLWVPVEYEVCGSVVWSSARTMATFPFAQYPLFENSNFHRIKMQGDKGTNRCDWWFANVASGTSTGVCYFNYRGYCSFHAANKYEHGMPLCFRIAA